MNEPEAPPAARVSAAQALLDRGWGKPAQTLAGDPDNPLVHRIERLIIDATNSDG